MQPFRRAPYLAFLCLAVACSDSNGPPATATHFSISAHPSVLIVGDTLRLAATAMDASGKPVTGVTYTWTSSAPAVLSVTGSGLLHGMSQGSAVISVTAAGARDTLHFDVSTSFIQLGQSDDHTCVTASSGAGYCRGPGYFGELGNGSTGDSPDFVAVAGGHTFSGVFPGVEFTCGLGTDSVGYCWGYGGLGSLGTGDTLSNLTPVAVTGGLHFAQLATQGQSACAITGAGAAYCWGWGFYGQTGDSTGGNTLVPTAIAGGHQFIAISTSLNTSCGVTTSHAAYCWGANGNGTLGLLTDTVFTTPTALAGGHTFQSLSVSQASDLECGAATDGTAYCWGPDGPHVSPTPVSGGHHFVQVSSTFIHACGITADSAAYCWLRDLVPAAIPGGLKLTAVASGTYHDCALAADSSAYCWFLHCDTEWDVGCTTPPAPVAFAAGHKFREIAVSNSGTDWACGSEADDTTLCWAVDRPALAAPHTVPGQQLHSIAIGDYGVCGIGADSLGYCAGLGGVDSVVIATPAAIPGSLKWSSLQVSSGNFCGVAAGSAYCGDHNTAPSLVPGSSGLVFVSEGFGSNCGLKTGGTVACWGLNSGGELGIGFASQWSTAPLAVSGGHAFQSIEAAGDHTCALTTDSAAYCWGSGRQGMLGTGDTASGPTPRAVNTSLKFGSLALGWEVSCGLTADGSAYCWGRGMMAPQVEQSGTKFKDIIAGGYNGMCGVTVAGDPLCWDLPAWMAPPRRAVALSRR